MKIQLADFIGQRCITVEQAEKLYNEIHPRLLSGEEVVINLDGVKTLLSLFLNNAIGPLFKDFDGTQLSKLLKFENLSESQQQTLDRVLDNAEEYHRNPARKKAVDEALARILEEMD